MRKKIKSTLLFICTSIFIIACSSPLDTDNPEDSERDKTVIAYFVGDNSLSGALYNNLLQIYNGYSSVKDKEKVNLLVYIDILNNYGTIKSNPKLFKFGYKNGKVDTIPVKSYSEQNSASPECITNILSYIQDKFPAKSYGFIWGSHGSGWYPCSATINSRTLGPDNGQYIELSELHDAIPESMTFDYILFDACFMSQGEVATLFRDKTKYLIVSPAELPAAGFPYTECINLLCNAKTETDYTDLCEMFTKKYANHWGTISLLDATQIEALATCFKNAIYTADEARLKLIPNASIQILDGPRAITGSTSICFDMKDLVRFAMNIDTTITEGHPTEWTEFCNAISRVVRYESHTPYISSTVSNFAINTCCGITTYWPISSISNVNWYYRTYEWTTLSGLDYVLDYLTD